MAVFPIRQDRIGLGIILAVTFIAVPLFGSLFLMEAVMIPFLAQSPHRRQNGQPHLVAQTFV